MATSNGPDLSPAKAAVERLMDDTCTITRNPDGLADAELDQDTMELVDPAGLTTVYGPNKKCSVSAPGGIGIGDATREQGGEQFVLRVYQVTIPLESAEVLKGDKVRIVSSRRDRLLVGQEFTVRDIVYGSMSVSRKLICEARR